MGRLTTANTLGAAVGATAASFALLPWLDLWWSFAAIAAAYLLLAAILVGRRARPAPWLAALAAAAAVALSAAAVSTGAEGLRRGDVLVERFAGPYGWTDVTQDADGYHKYIRHNVHYGLGSRGSSAMQLRQGQFPLLLHPRPARVAYVGLATGVTASAALDRHEVEQIVVMELIPEVVQAAALLRQGEQGAARRRARPGAGRRRAERAGIGHRPLRRDRLRPVRAVGEQDRLPLYRRALRGGARAPRRGRGVSASGSPAGRSALASSRSSPRASARPSRTSPSGSSPTTRTGPCSRWSLWTRPRRLARADLQDRMAALRPPPLGRERVLRSADDVVAWYVGDWGPLPGVPLNTDEHPVVEFSAPMTQRRRGLQLRGDRFHAYDEARLRQLPRGRVHVRPAGEGRRARPPQMTPAVTPGSLPGRPHSDACTEHTACRSPARRPPDTSCRAACARDSSQRPVLRLQTRL